MTVPLEDLIPHRPPMRFVDALCECTDTTASATVCFNADSFAVTDGFVLETALVECVAQTVAAAMGRRVKDHNDKGPVMTNHGMLVSISTFRIESRPPMGKVMRIEIRELRRLGPMLRIFGEVSCDGQRIASGELRLYV